MQFAILFGLNTTIFNYIGFITNIAKVPGVVRKIKKSNLNCFFLNLIDR